MQLYIKQKDSGSWDFPTASPDLDNLSAEELRAQGWYKFNPASVPIVELNQTASVEYFINGDTVTNVWTLTLKEGDELALAIRGKWMEVRNLRNTYLTQTDYTQIADSPIPEDKRGAWATYRQQLRDITLQTDPFNLVWPTDPDGKNGTIGVARV